MLNNKNIDIRDYDSPYKKILDGKYLLLSFTLHAAILCAQSTRHPVNNVKRIVTGGGDSLVKIWRCVRMWVCGGED